VPYDSIADAMASRFATAAFVVLSLFSAFST
jgi:hypothetical protein